MSTSTPSPAHALSPAARFHAATDPDERMTLRREVVLANAGCVRAFVRRLVPAVHEKEAFQAGALGLLTSLEKYDPSRGVPFWYAAAPSVRKELEVWAEHAGVALTVDTRTIEQMLGDAEALDRVLGGQAAQ